MPLSVADVSVGFTSKLDGLFKGLDAVAKRLETLTSQDVVIRLEVDSKTEQNITKIADRLDVVASSIEKVMDTGTRFAAQFGLSMQQVETSVSKTTTKVQQDFDQLDNGLIGKITKFGDLLGRFLSPRLTTTVFGVASGLSLLVANGFSLESILTRLTKTATGGLSQVTAQVALLEGGLSIAGLLSLLKGGTVLLGTLLPQLFGMVTIVGLLLRGVNGLANSVEGLLLKNPTSFLGQASNLLTNVNKGLFTLEFRLQRNIEKFRLIPGVLALSAAIFAKVSLGLTGLFAAGPIAVAGLQVAIRLTKLLGISIQSRLFRLRAFLGDGSAQFRLFLFSLRQLGPLLTGIGRVAQPLGRALEKLSAIKLDKVFTSIKATIVALLGAFDSLVGNVQRLVNLIDERLPGATTKVRAFGEAKKKATADRNTGGGRGPPDGGGLVDSLGLAGPSVLATLGGTIDKSLGTARRLFQSRLLAFTPGFKKALSSFLLGVLILKPSEITLPLLGNVLSVLGTVANGVFGALVSGASSVLAPIGIGFTKGLTSALGVGGLGSGLAAAAGGGGSGAVGSGIALTIAKGVGGALASPILWKPLLAIAVGAAVKASFPFLKELPKKFIEGFKVGVSPVFGAIRSTAAPFVQSLATSIGKISTDVFGGAPAKVAAFMQRIFGGSSGPIGKVLKGIAFTGLGIFQGVLAGGLRTLGFKKLANIFFTGAGKAFGRSGITTFIRNTFKIAGALLPAAVADLTRTAAGLFVGGFDLVGRAITGKFRKGAGSLFSGGPFKFSRAALGNVRNNAGLEPNEGETTEAANRTKRQQRLAGLLDQTVALRGKELAADLEFGARRQEAIKNEIAARTAHVSALVAEIASLEGQNSPALNKRRRAAIEALLVEQNALGAAVTRARESFAELEATNEKSLEPLRQLAQTYPELASRVQQTEKLFGTFLEPFRFLGDQAQKLALVLGRVQGVASLAGRKTSPLQALGQQGINIGDVLARTSAALEDVDISSSALAPEVDAILGVFKALKTELGDLKGSFVNAESEVELLRGRLRELTQAEGDLLAKTKGLATDAANTGLEKAAGESEELLKAFGELGGSVSRAAKTTNKIDSETKALLAGLGSLAEGARQATEASKKRAKGEAELGAASAAEAAVIRRRLQRNSGKEENRAKTALNLFARLGRATTTGINTNNESLDPRVITDLLTSGLGNRGDQKGGKTLAGGGKGFAQGALGKAFIAELEDIFQTAESADAAVRRLLLFIDNQGPRSAEALELVAATGKSIQQFATSKTASKDLAALFEPLGAAAPRVAGILTSFQALTQLLGTNKNVLGTVLKPNAATKKQLKAADIGLDEISNIITAEITAGVRNRVPFEQLSNSIRAAVAAATKGTGITESGLGINKSELEKSLKGKFRGAVKISDLLENGGDFDAKGLGTFRKVIDRFARSAFTSFRKAGGTIGIELIKGAGDFSKKIITFFDSTLGYHAKHESPPRGVVGTIERSFALAGLTIGQQLLRGVGALRDATQNFFREGFGSVVSLVQNSLVIPIQSGTRLVERSLIGLGDGIVGVGKAVNRGSPFLLKLTLLPLAFRFITRITGSLFKLGGAIVGVFGRTAVAAINAASEAARTLLNIIRETSKEVRDFGFQALRSNIGVSQFDQLGKALKRFDVDVTEVSQTLIILQQSVGDALRDPLGETAKNFQLAGIAIGELKDLDPVSLLFRIGEAAEAAKDSPEKLRRTLELAGASLTNLRAALLDRDGLAEEFRQAAANDLISPEELDRAKALVNAIQDIDRLVNEIKRAVTRGFGPLSAKLIQILQSGVLDRKPKILSFVEASASTVSGIVLKMIAFVERSINLGRFRSDISAVARLLLAQGQILVARFGLFALREAGAFLSKAKPLIQAFKDDIVADLPRQFLRTILSIAQGIISLLVRLFVTAFTKSLNFLIDQFPTLSSLLGIEKFTAGDFEALEKSLDDFQTTLNEAREGVEKFLGLDVKDGAATRNLEKALIGLRTQAEKNRERIQQLNPELFRLIKEIEQLAGNLPDAAAKRLAKLSDEIAKAKERSTAQTYKGLLEELKRIAEAAEEARKKLENFEQQTEPLSQLFSSAGSLSEFFNQIDINAEKAQLQIGAAVGRLRVIALEYPEIVEKARDWFDISGDTADVIGTIEEKMRAAAEAAVELQKLEQVAQVAGTIAEFFDQARQSDPFPGLRSVIGDALMDATRLEQQLSLGAFKLQKQLEIFAEFNKDQFLAVAKQLESAGVVQFSVGIEKENIQTLFGEITEQVGAAIQTQVRNKILEPLVAQVRSTLADNLVGSTLDIFRGLADGSILEAARTAEESAREAGVKFSKVLFVLGKLGESIFSKALDSFLDQVRERFTDSLTQAIVNGIVNGQTVGAAKEISEELRRRIGLAASGLLAVFGLVLSRLQSTAESTADSIESAVESSEAVRGVISGDTSVAIKEVGDKLQDALRGTESRLDTLIALTRAGLSGDAIPSVPVSPLSTVAATTL